MGPSFPSSAAAVSKKYDTSPDTSTSRRWWVMRCGALSTKVKPAGVCSPHLRSRSGAGMR